MNHYHGNCKLEERLTPIKNSKNKCLNYWCEEHQVLCGKSFWEIGFDNEEKSKDLWGVKYFNNHQFNRKNNKLKKRIPKNWNNLDCFNMIAYCMKECFLRNPLFQADEEKEKKERIKFANNKDNKLIDLFCDCSNNFEASKLRKEIIKKNTDIPKTINERLNDLMNK